MPIFSPKLRRMFEHSIGAFLFAIVILILAVALTFAEDWCQEHHRPQWLMTGFHAVSILLFVTDAIAITAICAKLMYHSLRDIFRGDDQ